jgi:multidrug efflux pump
VRDSIKAVIHTLLEAVALVVLVVIVFLQTWRASIIPLLAVPISIIGTFAPMFLFGFSINALSLFGLVLAIGIVVDDAIVVVENVERNIESGLSPKEASYQAMSEVSEPIIAIALTLIAVFVPIAFISGLTGQFYRQFALTIAISTVISAFNSLTLSPALAAILLKGADAPPDRLTRWMDSVFGGFFDWFNGLFRRSAKRYMGGVASAITHKGVMMAVYALLIGLAVFMFTAVPRGFLPLQDKQYIVSFAELPAGATLDRTESVIRRMSDIILQNPGVQNAVAFPGLSINGFTNSPNAGIVFITLKPFSERDKPGLSATEIAGQLSGQFMQIQDAFILAVPPPPVLGLGTIGGFRLQIEDRADMGYEALDSTVNAVLAKARQEKEINPMTAFSGYGINVPQLAADIDRTEAKKMGVSITDIFDTMQVYLGSLYINDFNKFGRTYRVIAQADAPYRAHARDILRLKTRNAHGDMVPLAAMVHVEDSYGPDRAMRYNAYRTAEINGAPASGFSSGQAQDAIAKILRGTLPRGMTFEWTELTYQQILTGDTALLVFPLCVLLVFMVLAAQYESLALPLAVIMIVPMCLLCAISGIWIADKWDTTMSMIFHFPFAGKDNNIFTQIGLIVLVGLACKNAILIVEFAHELELHGGRTVVQAAIEASRLRLRPILMTSFAFIMGVTPLVFSFGAGAEMRNAMGLAVFSGMLGVTFFGLFLTPVFYVLLRGLAESCKK